MLPEGLDWVHAPGPPPPPCLFLSHRILSLPHLELLEQILPLSPLAAASAATCLGSPALFVWPVCWVLSSRAMPGSLAPPFRLFFSHPLSGDPGCYGNPAAGTRWWLGAGSRECRSLHHFRHFRCQAPSRCSGGASWWGVTRGLLRPHKFLLGHGRWRERGGHGSEDISWHRGWGQGR